MTEMTVVNDDLYNGYASCPDKCRIHISHSKDNQRLWMQNSENIIREFIQKLSSFNNFFDAYAFLAHRRHDVAVLLHHKSDEGRTDYYGAFRKEDDHFRQNISAGDGEQFWKWQKKKIFELTRELISPIRNADINETDSRYFFENEYKTCLKELVTVDNMKAVYYSVTIKLAHDKEFSNLIHASTLSTIELYEFVERPNSDLIRIEYAPVNNESMKEYYKILDIYYKNLLNWRPDDLIEMYLSHAARLSFLLAHILPIRQGNSAVVEWMLRAIAYRNGLDLGYFNLAEDISWDFKAILTPNPKDYIRWYEKKLFIEGLLLNSDDNKRLFSFRQLNHF